VSQWQNAAWFPAFNSSAGRIIPKKRIKNLTGVTQIGRFVKNYPNR
jgi:hypothetical protein